MYFDSFPTILYGNTVCRDLTRRVKLDEETKKAISLYHSYEIKDGQRPDLISTKYYDDPYSDWVLWLTNDIVDPYYQWNLSEEDYNDYLIKKYGSIENAREHVVFYRNNWYDDPQQLTDNYYQNVMDPDLKKYWIPEYGKGTEILYWKRKEIDWVVKTNEIWQLTLTEPVNDSVYSVGSMIAAEDMNMEILAINKDTQNILIHHMESSSNVAEIDSIWIRYNESTIVAVESSELVYRAIPLSERVYWSPVLAYDVENETNIYNRSIRVLDKAYLQDTLIQIESRLQE